MGAPVVQPPGLFFVLTPLPAREGLGVGGERSERGDTARRKKRPGIEPGLFKPTPYPSLAGRGIEGHFFSGRPPGFHSGLAALFASDLSGATSDWIARVMNAMSRFSSVSCAV
jgi:hypothetical protein